MNATATLTRRENQIAELIAWGATKKEIANKLFISERTVENTARSIYEKAGVTKSNELSAWWFCTRFHISFDLSPIKRKIVAFMLLVLLMPHEIVLSQNIYRKTKQTEFRTISRTRARKELEFFEI